MKYPEDAIQRGCEFSNYQIIKYFNTCSRGNYKLPQILLLFIDK